MTVHDTAMPKSGRMWAGGLLSARVGRLRPLVEWLARYRWPVLLAAALLEGVAAQAEPADLEMFAQIGRHLLSGDLSDVYTGDYNQSGPLQLVLAALVLPFGPTTAGLLGLHAVGNVALLVGVILFSRHVRRTSGRVPSPVAELVVGAVCVAWFLPGDLWNGHLAEVGIPLLWMTAALLVRRGWVVGAAVLLALSAGLEPWGVLAVPILLHDLRLRSLLRGGSVFALVVAGLYLPFVLTGEFALFHHVWPLGNSSLAHLLWPGASEFTWYMRAVQGAVASGSCAAVVLLLRRHSHIQVVWLAPAAAVLGRLLLDPTMFSYYLVPVCLVAIVGAGWCLDARSRWPEVASIGGMIYLPFLSYGALVLPSVVLSLAATGLAVVAALRPAVWPGAMNRSAAVRVWVTEV